MRQFLTVILAMLSVTAMAEMAERAEMTSSAENLRARLSGETAFSACAGCHSVDPADGHRVGPNLAGIVGRPAASADDFHYSPALTAAGLTWSRELLFAWIAGSEQLVPGSWMLFHNPLEPEEVQAVIDYLAGGTTPGHSSETTTTDP